MQRSVNRNSWIFALGALLSLATLTGNARAIVGTLADPNGEAVGWGDNSVGESTAPPGIMFTAIEAGGWHSLGIKTDGTLAGWGYNPVGAITVPPGTFTAIAAGQYHSLGIRSDGTLAGWGSNWYGETTVPSGTFTAIAACTYHSLGIRSDGTLAGWGNNTYGQSTVPAGTFAAIAAGPYYSVGIRSDGTLAEWGAFTFSGGTPLPAGTFTAVAASEYHGLGIRTDGTLVAWGHNSYGEGTVPAGTFTAIVAGSGFSVGIRTDGTLAGWGSNQWGGTDVPAGAYVAVAAEGYHALAIRACTDYEHDLRVFGAGLTATLNRDVQVAGDATVESSLAIFNNAHLDVGGRIVFGPGSSLDTSHGSGEISTGGGIELLAGASLDVPQEVTLTSSGPLMGGGSLTMNGGRLSAQQLTFESGGRVEYASGEIKLQQGDLIIGSDFTGEGGSTTLVMAGDEDRLETSTSDAPGNLKLDAGYMLRQSSGLIKAKELVVDGTFDYGGATAGEPGQGGLEIHAHLPSPLPKLRIGGGSGDAVINGRADVQIGARGHLLVQGGALQIDPGYSLEVLERELSDPSYSVSADLVDVGGVLKLHGGLIQMHELIVNGTFDYGGATAGEPGQGGLEIRADLPDPMPKLRIGAGGGDAVINGRTDVKIGARGHMYVEGGALQIDPGYSLEVLEKEASDQSYSVSADTMVVAGALKLHRGRLAASEVTVQATGQLSGAGQIHGSVASAGQTAPGSSPGVLAISGDFTQSPTGQLLIELASPTEFDQLEVAGHAALDGALSVSLTGAYSPGAGASFDVLEWGSRSGSFSSISLPGLANGRRWDASQLDSTGVLTVLPFCDGDFDDNGIVNQADLALWTAHFGELAVPGTRGDGNGDGRVDGADFLSWQRQLGSHAYATSADGAVPEPTAIVLACLSLVVRRCTHRQPHRAAGALRWARLFSAF